LEKEGQKGKRKPLSPDGNSGRFDCSKKSSLATAGRSAGTGLHAGEHETLAFLEIDARVHEHGLCPFLQEDPETLQFNGRIAHLGRFGYVHSQ
jgi:hypothetical protein